MNHEQKLELIKSIVLEGTGSCLCGSRESCEVCDHYSYYNKLRDKVLEAIDGPKPKLTLEDYGRITKIKMEDIV